MKLLIYQYLNIEMFTYASREIIIFERKFEANWNLDTETGEYV